MKKKNLIFIISVVLGLFLCGTIVLAAFLFQTTVQSNATTGDINIVSEGYVSYALNSDVSKEGLSTEWYQAILKERAGEVEVDKEVETDISTNYGRYYIKSIQEAATYQSGVDYYIMDDTDHYIYKEITEFQTGVTYYTITYTKATSYSAETTYYRLGHKLDTSVTSETSLTNYYVLAGVDMEGFGVFNLASSYDASTKYFQIVYHPTTLTASGLINDPNSADYGVSCVNTYGTQRTGSLAETDNYLYLNQVGFRFEIQTNIACYVRIIFRDAWISSKLYRGSSTPLVKYTSKRTTTNNQSPFFVQDENWYYDTDDNVAYLKAYIEKRDTPYMYTFNIDPSYFYESVSQSYTERMIIQVSYSLEVIQANRAKAVWHIDPSEQS